MDLSPATLAGGFLVLTAVLSAIGSWRKYLRPKVRALFGQIAAVRDAILGRDEVRDSITKEVIAPALPGMGVRMAHQEQQMELLTVTVSKLVDQQERQRRLEERVDEHEDRLQKLEAAAVERVVARAETTAAYRAIETAIKATPDTEGEVLDDETD